METLIGGFDKGTLDDMLSSLQTHRTVKYVEAAEQAARDG